MKILVAVDGSAHTKRMLAYLAAHDEWLGPQHQYTLIHAVPALPQRAASALDKTAVRAYYEGESERVFKPIRSFFVRQGLQAKTLWRSGQPVAVIVAEAVRGRYELIAMGTHGHGSLAGLVLGSVASGVLASCKLPVLMLR